MFGLAYLLAFGVYLLISIGVVRRAIRYAQENGRSAKRWGWGAAFLMYSLVFWDWLPTVAVHQYYCATESGFWVYKTLDQWKVENPGVMERLAMSHLPSEEYRVKSDPWSPEDSKYLLLDGTTLDARYDVKRKLMFVEYKKPDGSSGYQLNERFRMAMKHRGPLFLHRWLREDALIDTKTNEILARYVDFSTSQQKRQAGWSGWKFWLDSRGCIGGRDKAIERGNFMNQFKGAEK